MNEHARPAASAPHRPIAFAPARAHRTTDPDGTIRISSPDPLGAYDPSLARLFRSAVEAQPGRASSCRSARATAGASSPTSRRARSVDALAAALLARGLSAERPVMILSANAIDHALLMLAGYTAGVPVAPISVAYSLQSQDFAKLRHIAELLEPGLIYVADTAPFAKALAAIGGECRNRREPQWRQPRRDAVRRSRAHAGEPRGRSGRRRERCRHDRENPVHVRLDRTAQGRRSTPTAC